jgi:hypothetical protein
VISDDNDVSSQSSPKKNATKLGILESIQDDRSSRIWRSP